MILLQLKRDITAMATADKQIDLNASGCRVVGKWYPRNGRADEERVTEEIRVQFSGTKATARTLEQKINRFFELARNDDKLLRGDGGDSKIYLEFAPDDTETVWRSRVLDGMVELTEKMMNTWKDGKIELRLVVERANWWEGAEAAMPLTNGNGTDLTTAINVYTCSDDGTGSSPNVQDGWVYIKAADVEGDMPGSTKLQMIVSLTPAGMVINKIWMGLFYDLLDLGGDPGDNIETFLDTDAGATVNADASGGTYYAITLGTSATVEAKFDLDNTYFRAGWTRFFLRTYQPAPDGTWVRVKIIDYESAFVVGTTPWVQIASSGEDAGHTRVYDLGLVQLPPVSYVTANNEVYGQLEMWNAGGGTLNLDAVTYFGVDCYAEMGRANTTDGIGDDTTNPVGVQIYEGWGSYNYSYVKRYYGADPIVNREIQFFSEHIGEGIWLMPGMDQYLHIITRAPRDNFPNDIDYFLQLMIKYRPRRRNL